MTFGQKLRELRTRRGLTQQQLAEELGVTKRTLINYESGHCSPKSMGVAAKIAQYFGISIDALMTPQEGFRAEAAQLGGSRALRDADLLVREVGGLFAGGELCDEDKDAVMRAIQEAYWVARAENRKYTSRVRRRRAATADTQAVESEGEQAETADGLIEEN